MKNICLLHVLTNKKRYFIKIPCARRKNYEERSPKIRNLMTVTLRHLQQSY